MTFLDRLMEISESKNLSQLHKWTRTDPDDEESGIHYNTLTNYKNDPDRIPKADILLKLHDEKGLSVDWLLFGTGEPYAVKKGGQQKETKKTKSTTAQATKEIAPDDLPSIERNLLEVPATGTFLYGSGSYQLTIQIPEIIIKLTKISSTSTPNPQDQPAEGELHSIPKLVASD